MEIRATSVFDIKTITAFSRMLMFGRYGHKSLFRFFLVISAVMIALAVYCIGLYDYDETAGELLGTVCFVWGCWIFLYYLFPKIQYGNMGKMVNTVNEYVFLDEKIRIISKGGNYSGEAEIFYSLIFKVVESSEYFFIFQNRSQVYIVDKSTVSGGTVEQLRDKLSHGLGKKYVTCKY